MRPHDAKPVRGLPEPLPSGEQMLWQGSPDWRAMALSVFHVRKLAIYFGVICALRAATVLSTGGSAAAAVTAVVWLLPLIAAAIAMMTLLAFLTARTSVYTVTSKRVILHIGVVLDLTFNLPFESIEQAGIKVDKNGVGDLPMVLKAPNKIAYVNLWPHARPWHLREPQPMMRAIPDALRVGAILSEALANSANAAVATAPSAVVAPTPQASTPVYVTSRNAQHGMLAAS